jgi:hypothetical protein
MYGIATQEDANVVKDAWSTTFSSVVTDTDNWEQAVKTNTEEVEGHFSTWRDLIKPLLEEVGTDAETTAGKVGTITTESSNLANTLKTSVIPAVSNTLTEVQKLTAGYATQRDEIIDLIGSYEDLTQSIKESVAAAAGAKKNKLEDEYEKENESSDEKPLHPSQVVTQAPSEPISSPPRPTSSGDSDGILNVGDEVTFTGGVYYHDSEGGGPTGSRGPGKKVRVDRIK